MTVRPCQSENYFSATNALEDEGFVFIGTYEYYNKIFKKRFEREMFRSKSGETYAFVSMNHYNTQIYSISLKKCDLKDMSDWSISY